MPDDHRLLIISRATIQGMVRVYSTWQENVGIFCDAPAICWKASQAKDIAKLRSENSEDALTWQFFRSLDAEELVSAWAKQFLGIEDEFRVYYWQRLADQSSLDPDIDRCLATTEPYHTASGRQRTETDLILSGAHNLVMVEVKLGYKDQKITGWRQSPGSPIAPQYEKQVRPLLVRPDEWSSTLRRFAQLYKNLLLGRCLAKRWLDKDSGADAVHLTVIVNGEAIEHNDTLEGKRYKDEFTEFKQTCSLPASNLHLATWQDLRTWLLDQPGSGLDFVKSRLLSHPLL